MPMARSTVAAKHVRPARRPHVETVAPGPAGGRGRPLRPGDQPWLLFPFPFGWFGWFGFFGAPEEVVPGGSAGMGWLGFVFGRYQTGSPPTVAWPRPGGSANHSSAGAFSGVRAALMKAFHAGAAGKRPAAPPPIRAEAQ